MVSKNKAVLCVRIGGGAEEDLRKNGIKPVEVPYFIHEALKDIK